MTRPEPEASALGARLAADGYEILVQPLLRIVLCPAPRGLPTPAAIAFTSANAVRAVASWSVAAAWSAVEVFAIGGATAAAARGAGFRNVNVAAGDAAALARAIHGGFDPGRGPLLYPAARDRAAELDALLPGVSVRTVEAYHAEPATSLDLQVIEALRAGALDGVLLFSRRTSEVFARLVTAAGLQEGLWGTTLYALSRHAAEPLAALAPAAVRVAPEPNEASLIGLLKPALAHP